MPRYSPLRVDTAVRCDVGVVGEVAVGVAHGLEETREGGHVAGESLVEDFLLQVVHEVGLERASVPRGQVVRRDEAPVERLQEIEIPDLDGCERVSAWRATLVSVQRHADHPRSPAEPAAA